VEADAALIGAAGIIVLDTEAFENADRSIIHAHRDAEMIFAHWPAQNFGHLGSS
jgi:hypothetical protein